MKKPVSFQIIIVLLAVIYTMSSAHAEGWKKSYHAGTFDKNFRYMDGTEIMSLTSHKGKLYAATGMWMNSLPLPDSMSAQILVKESPGKKWKLDYQTDKQRVRVDSLVSITLGTDGQGNKLSEPVNLLVAGLWDTGYPLPAAATVAVRDDATNKWITTDLLKYPAGSYMATIRAIGTHKDRITGVDHVFVAVLGIIYSGVYDSTVPGQIRWESKPELVNVDDRLMSFGECNGELYAAIKPAIYKRIDGPTPTWEKVYEYTTFAGDKPGYLPGGSSGMRGLTAIPNPQGDGEVLLMALEGPAYIAKIVYLDPSDNNSVTTDFDLGAFLKEQLKDIWSAQWNYVLAAYSDMERVTDPNTGEDLLMLGVAHGTPEGKSDSAWYLVRHPDATYTMHKIPYIFDLRGQPKTLSGNRTIRVSPFAKDNGQVLYFGGFDCANRTSHNTAWIYSTDIDTALGH